MASSRRQAGQWLLPDEGGTRQYGGGSGRVRKIAGRVGEAVHEGHRMGRLYEGMRGWMRGALWVEEDV